MILVTLGTQDNSFTRLLEAVEKQIEKGNIKEEVVVQAGETKFQSNKMEIFDYIPVDKFAGLVEKANILITHAGVGSILTGIKKGKKVIAAARLKEYGEHKNNHQLQILENFGAKGYIIPLKNFDELDKAIKEAEDFKPNTFISNNSNFIEKLKNEIEKNKNKLQKEKTII